MKTTQVLKHKKPIRVLIVDDDFEFSSLLASCLEERYDISAHKVSSAYDAMNELLDSHYGLVILDWDLAGMSGFKALQEVDQALDLDDRMPLSSVGSRTPVAVLSAHDSDKVGVTTPKKKHFHVRSVLSKRFGMDHICSSLEPLLLGQPKVKAAV